MTRKNRNATAAAAVATAAAAVETINRASPEYENLLRRSTAALASGEWTQEQLTAAMIGAGADADTAATVIHDAARIVEERAAKAEQDATAVLPAVDSARNYVKGRKSRNAVQRLADSAIREHLKDTDGLKRIRDGFRMNGKGGDGKRAVRAVDVLPQVLQREAAALNDAAEGIIEEIANTIRAEIAGRVNLMQACNNPAALRADVCRVLDRPLNVRTIVGAAFGVTESSGDVLDAAAEALK